jgi:AcrR family transcriptional regulator
MKKQRTREAIVDAALELFEKNGFDHTTIADIAAAADIAPRTFFGYFPSKEAVLFHNADHDYGSFKRIVDERPEGVTTMEAMRSWIQEFFNSLDSEEGRERKRRKCIAESEDLAAYERGLLARFGDVLAEGVARDLGIAPDSPRARMTAAAAIASFQTLGHQLKDSDPPEDPMAIIDEAIEFIAAGIGALQARD